MFRAFIALVLITTIGVGMSLGQEPHGGPGMPGELSVGQSPRVITPGQPEGPGGLLAQDTVVTAPTVSLETTGPLEVNAGKPAEFGIAVQNLGEFPVFDATVVLTLPNDLRFVESRPQPSNQDGLRLYFHLGELKSKANHQIVLRTEPTQRAEVKLDVRLRMAAVNQIQVQVREPKLDLQLEADDEIVYGQPSTHRLVVTNSGDGVATNISLQQVLRMSDGRMLQEDAGQIPWLEPGQSRELLVNVPATFEGHVDLHYELKSDGGNSSTDSRRLTVLRPQLQVRAEGPGMVYLHRAGIYTIHVSNPGDSAVENVSVVTKLPAGMLVTTLERPAKYDQEVGTLTWTIQSLGAGGEALLRFKALCGREGKQIQSVRAIAEHGLASRAQQATIVLSRPQLSVQIAHVDGPIEVGQEAVFNVVVGNRGTRVADDVRVLIRLPEGLKATDTLGEPTTDGQLALAPMSVAPGKQHVVRFSVVAQQEGEHVVRATLVSEKYHNRLMAESGVFVYKSDVDRLATEPVETLLR
jgi:hypothetical protein